LPAGALHQYAPLDAPQFMRRFIKHWRPDVALIAESELWPNMILEASAAGTPIILVNARLSERSYLRWKTRLPAFIAALVTRIDLALAQSKADAERYSLLGAPRVECAGNLKFDAPAPPADRRQLAILSGRIAGRRVWIAASTHDGEEAIAAEAHRLLAARFPELLTLIAPRHPNRGPEIAERLQGLGLTSAMRSQGAEPGAEAFYICDTMGELGLFYRLAGVVFLGKSLVAETGGGQNPIEPILAGKPVVVGPHMENFQYIVDELRNAGGIIQLHSADALVSTLADLLRNPSVASSVVARAFKAMAQHQGAIRRTASMIIQRRAGLSIAG
jgi:3-deoxy-D-manno-octulosonic-acid transferase